jgi:ABC-type Mn2+/Zn2+ transport system permease subunit
MRNALVASIMISVICAVIGAFVVLQDLSFIGDALAHASFPGVVIAFLLKLNITVGGTLFGIATALGIGYVTRRSKVSLDTAIGVLFAGTFAGGVLLLSTVKTYTQDLFGLLLGDVLAISQRDMLVVLGTGLLVVGIIAALYKELVLMSFDPTAAEVQGLPTGVLHYLLLALLAVTVVVAIQSVGIVLVVALLVTPAATGFLVVRRFHHLMLWGAVQGTLASITGIYVSFYLNVASGATIVVVNTLIFALVLLLSGWWGRLQARLMPAEHEPSGERR